MNRHSRKAADILRLFIAAALLSNSGPAEFAARRPAATPFSAEAFIGRSVFFARLWKPASRAQIVELAAGMSRKPGLWDKTAQDAQHYLDRSRQEFLDAVTGLNATSAPTLPGEPWLTVRVIDWTSFPEHISNTVSAYQFTYKLPGQKDPILVIVLNKKRPMTARQRAEILYHERREAYWMFRGETRRNAHRLASAEQLQNPAFAAANGILTDDIQAWLSTMSTADLERIAAETEDQRKEVTDVLFAWAGDSEAEYALQKALDNEDRYREAAVNEVRARNSHPLKLLIDRYQRSQVIPLREFAVALGLLSPAEAERPDLLRTVNPRVNDALAAANEAAVYNVLFQRNVDLDIRFRSVLVSRARDAFTDGNPLMASQAAYRLGIPEAGLPVAIAALNADPETRFYLELVQNQVIVKPLRDDLVRQAIIALEPLFNAYIRVVSTALKFELKTPEQRRAFVDYSERLRARFPHYTEHPSARGIDTKEKALVSEYMNHLLNNALNPPLVYLNDWEYYGQDSQLILDSIRKVLLMIRQTVDFFKALPELSYPLKPALTVDNYPPTLQVWLHGRRVGDVKNHGGRGVKTVEDLQDALWRFGALDAFGITDRLVISRVYGKKRVPLAGDETILPNDRLSVDMLHMRERIDSHPSSGKVTVDEWKDLKSRSIAQLEQLLKDIQIKRIYTPEDVFVLEAEEELRQKRAAVAPAGGVLLSTAG